MKKYLHIYYDYFDLEPEADIVWDEYEWVINRKLVVAVNVHHIEHGANKHDHIDNLIGLSYNNHVKAHNEVYNRHYLKGIHLDFLKDNPYD